ncbi:MAG: T9SS type A sorting domain-containing protein [Prolixibacteraceae bacterium]|jgi:hypothetical protein|nr:T9SS type A sorting domain-containing protein [Prolixibacteraceae bacterium]MBT6764445.1 T9SS type A sorting domain-containing protein [Prolixibacteraceae bacterium]MBT7000385.1 T9SS type A sorting domain-containing protein [Prolixibacteraceae bacterium]
MKTIKLTKTTGILFLFLFISSFVLSQELKSQQSSNTSEVLFYDDFEDEDNIDFSKWTTENLEGWHYWHIVAGGGHVMRFEKTDIAQNDWLITKQVVGNNIENILINFDHFYFAQGLKPKLYYTNHYNGLASESSWNEINYSLGENENEWYNSGDIIIENPGDTLYFAFQYNATPEEAIYFLFDNFKAQNYAPLVYDKVGESEHFEFYATSEQANYWDTISASVDDWFKELCSFWDRPQTDPLFLESEKVKIYLTDKNQIDEQIGITTPDWKYGGYKLPDEIYVAIPPGGDNDIYEDSFKLLVKNIFSQFVLKKRNNRDHGGYLTDYYSEAFGLYQSGYRPNRDSILHAINELGRLPMLSDIENVAGINNTYKKDLLVSYIESLVLSLSYQSLYHGHEEGWQAHLKYYYQAEEENRMGLKTSSTHFDIYSIARDTIYNKLMIQQLEELFIHYTSLFELNIHCRINIVIYPDIETATGLNGESYSIGSAQGGDLLNVLSPHTADNPMEAAAAGGLLAHEFWHVVHFHMRPYNGYSGGYFIMEGMADYMREGTIDMVRTVHDLWKVEELLYNYYNENSTEPTLEYIMNNPQVVEPYLFGQIFFNYLIPDVASYIEVKNFFLGRCDWLAINVAYEEIEKGYINYLKSLVNYAPPDTLVEIPFDEQFDNFFNGWSKPNFNNPDNWQINDGGFDGGNCARFYTHSDTSEPIESWLISPPLNAENMEQIKLSFDFARYGEGIELEVFYTNSFKGYTDSTNWTSANRITMPNDWGWSNSGEITISNPPDTVFIGLQKKSTGEQHLQLYIDNFKVNGNITNVPLNEHSKNDYRIYPNPITNTSIISFTNTKTENINLSIFDLQGRKICTVLDKNMSQGNHSIPLGKHIQTNGVYFCRLATTEGVSTLKLVVN